MNLSQLIKEREEEFDKRFVVDENSAEEDGKGGLKWCEDTRLIADFIEGKTLTATHIKKFHREDITLLLQHLIEKVEGEKKPEYCTFKELGYHDKNCENCEWNEAKDQTITYLKEALKEIE